jgi:hypothetical protein
MPATKKAERVTERAWAKETCREWHELVTEPMIDGFLAVVRHELPDFNLHSGNEFDVFEYHGGYSLGVMLVGEVMNG